ncbi:MAG TPA: OsmC family peroxiredoxin [Actinospica sp.]|nr:OsmC family peroxiredoxin [Actinospica sp.]
MATTSKASAHWEGSLLEGKGAVSLDSSHTGTFDVDWKARSGDEHQLTSPEELIAAAHSTCYSMALSHALAQNGTAPSTVDTKAEVDFQPGTGITGIRLSVRAAVPGLTEEEFVDFANKAKEGCPVSQALKSVPITLETEFVA